MNLRSFLKTVGMASLAPPLPLGFRTTPITSPKGREQVQSWGKKMVSLSTEVHPMAKQPLKATVTGMTASISVSGGNVNLAWVSGTPPFKVLYRAVDTDPWVPATEALMARHVSFPMFSGQTGFFKIWEQVPLLTGERVNNVTTLSWEVPLLE